MILQSCLYLLRSTMVLHLNRHCLSIFCQLFTTHDIFFYSFSSFLKFMEEVPSISLSLSLSRLRRRHWFGGGVMAPPPKAPREGSALEATTEGGGLVIAIIILHP